MKKIDRFLLRDILSDGPAGTVYRAEEILPGDNRRTVALKILPIIDPSPTSKTGESPAEKRFFAEVKVLAQLGIHPHVVTLYAMGLTDGYPWLAMEFAPAMLQQKIADTPAESAEVLRLLDHVSRGLAAMHALKPPLIHQDLKPANILVDPTGNYKITDFSLATVTAENRTFALATVRYAAPEMLSNTAAGGGIGPATDLYALGHIAYEFALGTRLHRQQFPAVFEGNSKGAGGGEPPPTKWMSWHSSRDTKLTPIHALRADFPPAVSEVIMRLLAKPIAERYSSAADVLSDLAVLRQNSADLSGQESPPRNALAPSHSATMGTEKHAPTPTSSPVPHSVTPPPSAPSAAHAGPQFWVRLRGKISGPFSLATLRQQVKQGHVSRFHQVSTDQQNWKPASTVEGLYGP